MWRWFNRRSIPAWLLLVWSTTIAVLDWIGRAELGLRIASAIGIPHWPTLVWAVPALAAFVWLVYVAARPLPLPSWSEYRGLGVRWGIRGSPNGSFEMLGPYCPNAGHGNLLQIRTATGLREFSVTDSVDIAGGVLSCPLCGGSYTLDCEPGEPKTIQQARAQMAIVIRARETTRGVAAIMLALLMLGLGIVLGNL